jgi:S-adenosylmethionine/arginine decarboxylase-like enzyme
MIRGGEEGLISTVKRGFATHFMADLYFCQNKLWEQPCGLLQKVREVAATAKISGLQWEFQSLAPDWIRISGEFSDSFLWIQIFPEESFLTIDIFSWKPRLDLKDFNESLIEIFEPQVIALESKIRAEHLG